MTPHDTPDAHLPVLTTAQADRLRGLVAAALERRHGTPPAFEGDTVAVAGHRHPLTNLAQRCRVTPEVAWPELVEQQFAHLAEASQGGESAEELLAGTRMRLVAPGAVPADGADRFSYMRAVAPGLNLALALDAPTTVRLLNDQDVARAGDPDALWEAAGRNLSREPFRHEEVRLDGHPVLHSVYGDSVFVASKALLLPELAAEVTGRRLPGAGALVVVPTRHLLAFHPITDGSAVDAVNDLATYAVRAHDEGPGSLSPRVYWWHEGRLTSLTVIDEERQTISQQPPAELVDVLRLLRGLDRAGRLVGSARPVEVPALTASLAASIDALDAAPDGLPDAFTDAVLLAQASAEADPDADRVETWDAWVAALQLGTALFTETKAVTLMLGDTEHTVPATGTEVRGDARAWLDAFYLTLVTRERDRTTRLCEVPLDTLRAAGPVDDYVLHWIDTLQSHWLRRPTDDVVTKLVTTMERSHPEASTRTPKDFLDLVDYQPVALFHRLLTQDHEAFGETLTAALGHHARYWGDSAAPGARVALGPLALACLAHDMDFPLDMDRPYLPKYLLDRQRLEHIPG
ncbi:immunity 49 family protein [Streptomyces sp. NPDC050145]|uniref:immunity 49 family protein n=1 Tax=Streptomyces sp. NPDC050145 TaxID=3365602 RepID=UPI003794BBB2